MEQSKDAAARVEQGTCGKVEVWGKWHMWGKLVPTFWCLR